MNFQAKFLPTVGKHAALTMVAIAPATGAAAEVPANSSNPEAGGWINRCDDGSKSLPTYTLRGWWNLHLACRAQSYKTVDESNESMPTTVNPQ